MAGLRDCGARRTKPPWGPQVGAPHSLPSKRFRFLLPDPSKRSRLSIFTWRKLRPIEVVSLFKAKRFCQPIIKSSAMATRLNEFPL